MTIEFEISTKKGDTYTVYIDEIDKPLLSYHWHSLLSGKKFYVATSSRIGKRTNTTLLHRAVAERMIKRDLLKGEYVDHIDGSPFNNTRENLRIATNGQNRANSPMSKNNKSGYKGVRKSRSKYEAWITVNRKPIYLGSFPTPELAHEAYKQAATKYFGEFARFE